jgi:oligopeptidase B
LPNASIFEAARAAAAPLARREDTVVAMHGRERLDPYAWLKDENWRDVMRDPSRLRADIRSYLEAENAFTRRFLEEPAAALQETLFQEMKGRIKEDDSSVPAPDGPWAYYRRFAPGGEHPLFVRRPRERAFEPGEVEEQLVLDADALAEGRAYFDIRKAAHSPDHRLFAYALDDKGSEFYTIHIRDIASGADLQEEIASTYGDFVWGEDSASLFWVARDESARSVAVYRRRLGTGQDDLIYRESDPGFFVGVGKSESRRFIFVTANTHTTSEWRWFPADEAEPVPRLIAAREDGVEYQAVDFDGRFWLRTNRGGALDFSLWSAPYDATGPGAWREEVPYRAGVLLLDVEAFENHLARLEREDGQPRIVVRERASGAEHMIAFDAAAYDLGIGGAHEWRSSQLRFAYSSPATPAQVFDYDMATRERVLRKTQDVPSGHDPDNYVVERLNAPAPDGETIPIVLLRRKETPLDGSAPVLLYGYGAYGITLPADFRTARLSLVDRGFIYATADVRGSMAKGYRWYLDGKLDKKVNTFTDFVAAGRYLVAQGLAREGRIIAMGGSAGGMLVGAAVNLDPGLFGGVIAAVPFVDVLNTMSDASLPLTPPEWPEWGDPISDPAAYDRILSYSPYDQTARRPYPQILATGGLTDPRVTYWEPAKWVARLRHEAPQAGPYFLRINMDAGHGGASGRYASLRETALEYAFALHVVGLGDEAVSP